MTGPTPEQLKAATARHYPTCGTCGHHTSAVLAGQCTALVPFDNGGSDYGANYCDCRCVDDPVVAAWLAGRKRP